MYITYHFSVSYHVVLVNFVVVRVTVGAVCLESIDLMRCIGRDKALGNVDVEKDTFAAFVAKPVRILMNL